jgi:ComF family protein
VFPDECRLCEQPLTTFSRIPVCSACLSLPQPLESELFCRSCRTAFASEHALNEQGLCVICRQGDASFDFAYSFGSYEGPLKKLIHLLKYGKVEILAAPLSRFLLRALPRDLNFDHVIAMPMHWRKRWERGFNQADLLGTPVAERFGLRLSGNLCRNRYTKSQAGLDEQQRRKNLKGSFSVRRPDQIKGKKILLIDDVFTTGATLRAAARTLKEAGAAHVSVLTLARVDRHMSQSISAPLGESKPDSAVLARMEAS